MLTICEQLGLQFLAESHVNLYIIPDIYSSSPHFSFKVRDFGISLGTFQQTSLGISFFSSDSRMSEVC